MERGRAKARILKGIGTCVWKFFCIAIDIVQVGFEWLVVSEGPVADAGHAVGDGDGGQEPTVLESGEADACHAFWDVDGGQIVAAIESHLADIGHAIRDGNGGQSVPIIEGKVADAGHAVGDNQITYLFSIQEKGTSLIKWI